MTRKPCRVGNQLRLAYNAAFQDELHGRRPEYQTRYLAAALWEHRAECPQCRSELEAVFGITPEGARERAERLRYRRFCEEARDLDDAMQEIENPEEDPRQWLELSGRFFDHILKCDTCLVAMESQGWSREEVLEELDERLPGSGEEWKE